MPDCRWITLAELDDRQTEWRQLALGSSFPTAYADPAWILAWWQHYGDAREPWSLALEDRRDGSLRGLALLARGRSPFGRKLTFAGDGWNGLESLICAPGAEAELSEGLITALGERRREWDVWRVQRLPTASVLARTLLDGEGDLRAAAHDLRLQPFLDLPAEIDAFEARFGGKQRSTQRRKWKRLIALGAVARLVSAPDEIDSSMRVLLDQRRQRAISQGQRYKHMDTRFERFLVDAVGRLLPAGARLWLLELDGSVLASRLNLVQGPREHSYLLGLGDEHANLSPGTSLEHHAICQAIGEGRTELDLGPGRDAYKYRLRACDRELTRLVVSSESLRGRGVTGLAAADLRLRNTGAADVLRRRRGLTPERVTSPVRQNDEQRVPDATTKAGTT
jgi:CelD/BcsL family acetyltransferase involved in cellulose biosynthesis